MDFDKDKFKMVLHHIIYKCGFRNTVGRTVLHKLLYFSDFNYYKEFNQSITNESYVKKERGPVPIHFEMAMGPEIDLKNEELTIVNKVIKELSHLNGKQIGEYSLRDYPVKRTEEDEIIDYDLTFSRKSNNHDKVYVKIS